MAAAGGEYRAPALDEDDGCGRRDVVAGRRRRTVRVRLADVRMRLADVRVRLADVGRRLADRRRTTEQPAAGEGGGEHRGHRQGGAQRSGSKGHNPDAKPESGRLDGFGVCPNGQGVCPNPG
ncbi:hypothetical protein [Jiangella muralis]|uniref:hypothetical protein n=1 Tax=Jiangella muralis TaxID=702383 RepID=UPI00069F4532|nr:hypothetical protein [Jiangella muralis]